MKYGKEFQQILNDSHFPEDWKASAIEYRQLKKLIKDVVHELQGMGLSPEVLHKLLVTEETPTKAPSSSSTSAPNQPAKVEEIGADDEVLEFEFESDTSPPTHSSPFMPDNPKRRHSVQEVTIAPVPGSPDSNHAGPSTEAGHHARKFRLRLLSESAAEDRADKGKGKGKVRPMGVMAMMEARERSRSASASEGEGEGEEKEPEVRKRRRRVVKRAVGDGQAGVRAEYVIAGDGSSPVPQLRLHVAVPLDSTHSPISPSTGESDLDATTTSDDDDEVDAERGRLRTVGSPDKTPRPPRDIPTVDVIPPSPSLERVRTAVSPIWALASGSDLDGGMRDLSLEPSLPAPSPKLNPPPTVAASDSPVERDFVVPLSSDHAFFSLLTSALTTLSTFHSEQQRTFERSVTDLCSQISQSIQPSLSSSDSPLVLPTPLTTTPVPLASRSALARIHTPSPSTSRATSKKDLYAWRQIFTLWIESEIFESRAERDRGERPVEVAEMRLKAFANEVVKRGLGDRRTIKGKRARGAWEEFLRLNVLLLDLKRFQMANVNAARKILKKHDKRTALTASSGFPSFISSTLSSKIDKSGNPLTWAFHDTSLPHVLLASLTDTLLPILPSLDDYACLICTSIAFKPIRLSCSHLFCVRCLVKMQRAGKTDCPLCRSKVVLLADKNSLDHTVMNFMKEWFPKEVKEKRKENELEVAKEQAEQAGMDTRCCVM